MSREDVAEGRRVEEERIVVECMFVWSPPLTSSLRLDGVEVVALSPSAEVAAGAARPREAVAGDVQEGKHARLRPLRDEAAEASERHAPRTAPVDGRCHS